MAVCANCEHPVTFHGGVTGCVSVFRAGGTPCGCKWHESERAERALTSWLGISMGTLCEACGHSANVHDGPPNAVKACITCTCPAFWLRCKSQYIELLPTHFNRHECELARGHLEDHKKGDLRWTEAVASYLTGKEEGVASYVRPPLGFDSEAANPDRTKVTRDTQVGGNHYRRFKIQPWDVIDEYGLDFYRGNVVKYLLRAGHKGVKLEDLKKARHYLDRVIEIEEAKEG